MLDKEYQEAFTPRAKAEANKLLKELGITVIDEDNICDLQELLDTRVVGLVNQQESGEPIDEELLDIYDLLTDIVIEYDNDKEENYKFLNQLFFE